MRREEFQFLVDTKREFEFPFNGKNYNLTYGTDDSGADCIVFGETFQGRTYASFGELMNSAKIGNYFLREVIKEL